MCNAWLLSDINVLVNYQVNMLGYRFLVDHLLILFILNDCLAGL